MPYRILMSHDPTHWEEQVHATGIDLTLSGHTHGAQLGVKIGSTTYSPAQWVYKQWAGLYSQGAQQLYVNRGFGFIGFPGRVGMPPEITVLECCGPERFYPEDVRCLETQRSSNRL